MKKYSVAQFTSGSRKSIRFFDEQTLLDETSFFRNKEDAINYMRNMQRRSPEYSWVLSEYNIERDPDIEEIITHQYILGGS